MLPGQFHHCCLAVIHSFSAFNLHQRRATFSDPVFFWLEGITWATTHQKLSVQYGNSVLPQRSVYEWVQKLKNGCTSVTYEEEAGRLSTATN
jgi:hypothetical protein